LHSFLEVDKTQDLPSKFWQTLGDEYISIFFLLLCLFFLFIPPSNAGFFLCLPQASPAAQNISILFICNESYFYFSFRDE
jgi:quinol-cytochrome oxidoreductase complex cytochrome b subunit